MTSSSASTSATSTKGTTNKITGSTSQGVSTIPITTTFTSSSQRCVATLEAQVLADGATAVIISNGTFVTLNNTCHLIPTTMASSNLPFTSTRSAVRSSSSSASGTTAPQKTKLPSGTMAGLIIGVLAVIGCLVGVIFWLWLRRRRRNTTVFTLKAKDLDKDCSSEVTIRWEKDSADEIRESDSAEVKEMSAGPLPVEMGDGRSMREVDESAPLSPISIDTRDGRDTLYGDIDKIVSPLSPKS